MIIALYHAEVMEEAMAESQKEREFSVCAPVNIIELLCNTSVFVLVLALLIC